MSLTYSRSANFNNRSYLPPGWPTYSANNVTGQRFAMWYPDGKAPPGGWPVCIFFHFTNFGSSNDAYASGGANTIGQAFGFGWQLLNNKIATMHVQVTAPNKNNPSGRGFWHPPGNLTNTERRFESPEFPSCFKDAILAIQHLRFFASTYNINPEMVGVHGASAGAHLSSFLSMSPNMANLLGTGGPFEMSTVPNAACLLRVALASWDNYDGTAVPIVPPTLFSQGVGNEELAAANLTAVSAAYKRTAEWRNWVGAPSGPVIAPTTTWTDTASASDQFYDEAGWETGVADTTQLHNAWHFAVMKARYGDRVRFYLPFSATDDATNTLRDGPFVDGPISQAPSYENDPVIDGFLNDIRKKRWDLQVPDAGIFRKRRVESVGYVVAPPNPNRSKIVVQAVDDVRIGANNYSADFVVGAGQSVEIPGGAPIYARSAGASAELLLREVA